MPAFRPPIEDGRSFDAAGVLFDMDGVLTLNSGFHAQAWQRFAREFLSLTLASDDARVHGGRNVEILAALTGQKPDEAALRHCEEHKERYYRELAAGNLQPTPGVMDYLDHLDRLGVPFALVTSADTTNMSFVLSELGLEGRFETRVSAEDIQHGKPHPEPFLKAAQSLGVAPGQCLVHEDAPSGVRAGVAAGCLVAALTTTVDETQLRSAGAACCMPDFTRWVAILRG